MAQITIYLPDDVAGKARKAAADQVVHTLADTWPAGVLEAAGAVPDFPSLEEIREGCK